MAHDAAAFANGVDACQRAHKKQYEKMPNDPLGFVSLLGLSVCRMAGQAGMEAGHGTYLPVRLLPAGPMRA